MAASVTQDHVRAFQRFGLGGTGGSLAGPMTDSRGAVLAELSAPSAAILAGDGLPSAQQALSLIQDEQRRIDAQAKQRPAGSAPGMAMAMPSPDSEPRVQQPVRQEVQIYRREVIARFGHAHARPIGVVERLVMFWSNHFCISAQKGAQVRAIAGAFEREAIRPHVLGRFEDMLVAVARHQAMLIFLDQRQSVGPNSRAGRNRSRGLNENLAREILELHTLGVDGGYSQADVTAFARVLTGWMVAGPNVPDREPGSFFFNPNAHEPGSQTVLGRTYAEGGMEQGEAVLRDLARHPATARHVARRLARHFVADEPSPALVARLEAVFRDTAGNLRKLAESLVKSDESWSVPATKLRAPYEFLLAAHRIAGAAPQEPGPILGPLAALGQPLWAPSGPNGFSDSFAALAAPEAMKTRLEVAWALGRRLGAAANAGDLADAMYGETFSRESRQAISRAESRQQALALLLMSPEFQRR